MSAVAEIKTAIKSRTRQLRSVGDLVDEVREDAWDKQIDAVARAGKLDKLAEKAIADYRAGRCKPRDEILNSSDF